MRKFYHYLKYSYHRPSAKFRHLLVFFYKILYNKKTKVFAERIFLEKNPPESMRFFNLVGRLYVYIKNFLFIILLSRFEDASTYLDDKPSNEKILEGNNFYPWPLQADHLFETSDKKYINNIDYELLYLNYKESCAFLESKDSFKENKWWESCREEFKKIFVLSNNVNVENLNNFRRNTETKAEILSDQNFLFSKYKKVNQIKSLSLINLYHKLSEVIDINILRSASESYCGNNVCLSYRSQRLSYRVLRYAYYLSQIKNHLNLSTQKKNVVVDIGGGYGGLTRTLKNYYTNSTFVIIELPELCLLSYYFLSFSFPKKKIGIFKNFKDFVQIDKNDLIFYDFVILPPPLLELFKENIVDLTINTTSLGEMTDEMQKFYINNIERTSKYFYSVNRAEERKDKYESKGFYQYLFNKRWKSLIYNFTHTYHVEFLGEKVE